MTGICMEKAETSISWKPRLSRNYINREYRVTRNTELREERCTWGPMYLPIVSIDETIYG